MEKKVKNSLSLFCLLFSFFCSLSLFVAVLPSLLAASFFVASAPFCFPCLSLLPVFPSSPLLPPLPLVLVPRPLPLVLGSPSSSPLCWVPRPPPPCVGFPVLLPLVLSSPCWFPEVTVRLEKERIKAKLFPSSACVKFKC